MDDPKLREQLEQLQVEIRQSRSVDEEGKALLRDLDADILTACPLRGRGGCAAINRG
jgi:hypothetical protein